MSQMNIFDVDTLSKVGGEALLAVDGRQHSLSPSWSRPPQWGVILAPGVWPDVLSPVQAGVRASGLGCRGSEV